MVTFWVDEQGMHAPVRSLGLSVVDFIVICEQGARSTNMYAFFFLIPVTVIDDTHTHTLGNKKKKK